MRKMPWIALTITALGLVGCGGPSDEKDADITKPGKVEVVPAKPGMKPPEERGTAGQSPSPSNPNEEGTGH